MFYDRTAKCWEGKEVNHVSHIACLCLAMTSLSSNAGGDSKGGAASERSDGTVHGDNRGEPISEIHEIWLEPNTNTRNGPLYASQPVPRYSGVTMATMTNVLRQAEGVVEAKCVWFTSSWRLDKSRAASQRTAVDWVGRAERYLLDRKELRLMIHNILGPLAHGADPEEVLDVLEGQASMARENASAWYRKLKIPYERILDEGMDESERKLFLIVQAHFKAVLYEEFASLLLEMTREAQDKYVYEGLDVLVGTNGIGGTSKAPAKIGGEKGMKRVLR